MNASEQHDGNCAAARAAYIYYKDQIAIGCPDCPVFVTFQMLLPLAITNCGRLRDNLITLSNEGALRSRRHPRYCLPVGSKRCLLQTNDNNVWSPDTMF